MRNSFIVVVATALATLAAPASVFGAYDFTAKPALAALGSCTPQLPGTAAPQVRELR